VTLATPPVDAGTLQRFYDRIHPFDRGWRRAVRTDVTGVGSASAAFLAWGLGCVTVYAALFGIGMTLYGRPAEAIGLVAVAVAAGAGLFRTLPRIGFQ
jgi:hypothetical protein